jgi:pyruvate dehydrogenase E1 component alpha subunit
MPRKTVYTADIQHLQLLDEEGNLDEKLAHDGGPLLSDAEVKSLYEQMVINREYDEVAQKLQRSGRMGTFPQNKGQEAASLGAAKAIRKGYDWLVPYYRENAASFLNGLPMHYIYLFWMGDERGNEIPDNLAQSPVCVEIGAQILHASGIAWAFKLRKQSKVVLGFMGDGATSTGDFHEGMNFAATYKLPVVFSCLNNGWAISVPCSGQTGSETFAQKGLAYGMPSMQVDGNDIFAVYRAHKLAIERARNGEGPQFIEQLTYRLGDHTTADDARRYRKAEELELWQKRDPLMRTRKYLERKGMWDDAQQQAIEQRAKVIVQEVTRTSLEFPAPTREDIFDYVYARLTPELVKQRATNRTDSIGQDPEQIGLKASEHHV